MQRRWADPSLWPSDAMTDIASSKTLATFVRWSARALGVITGGFLLLMFFGYALQGQAPSPGSLTPFAAFGLALLGTYALAMFVALRWERIGAMTGAIVLLVFFAILYLGLLPGNVSGGFSTRGVLNPVFLALWLPILLYFTCWRLDKRRWS